MHPSPPYGRDFWPRTRRIDVQADVDFDRPCGNCGYNLRGLPISSPCPECGSIGGINISDETIPWDERANLLSFIGTMLLAIFRPHTFAKLAWSPQRFEMPAARNFRRITLLIAVASLSWIAEEITRSSVGLIPAIAALPFQAASIFLWLNSVSLEPIMFVKGTASPVARRAEVVAHYISSVQALMPLQLMLLPLSLRAVAGIPEAGWLVAAGAHLVLLLALMLPGNNTSAWMFYELVEISRSRALGYTLMRSMTAVGAALPMLIGIPALAAVASKAITG